MGLTVGPATWHPDYQRYLIANTPLGSALCGGFVFNRADGIAWIVAPFSTQVSATWNGTTSLCVGNKPCVSDWSSLSTALTGAGLTPSQWFVPSFSQLQTGYNCRTFWGTSPCFCSACYWSSTEVTSNGACGSNFSSGGGVFNYKSCTFCVRAFRFVSY